ncbi:hypothetical protein [Parasphaerochaeta coccoides]|uniref:Uncharacterized protein n=1 Tax=Parasphaerochaeta coccoides (strain ATCC BAA-1237 / DSM 17374 / SPN1) TaxID=760011 RepID=F4GJ79_PARC1|nr:hypothetical protein [Parasphaerochaeta coccoides]AEC01719.1 hypothetical protein Spico_0491 [Parasphaerochaeta coccoides DSM 17374]
MEIERRDYYGHVHFLGRLSICLEMIFLVGIALYLSFVKGYHPGWDKISIAFLGVAAMVGHVWFNITDYITYVLVMGPAATYLSSITGDIKNMRLPSAMAAVSSVDEEAKEGKRDILATCGVLVSVILNLILSIILVIFGSLILKWVPQELKAGLDAFVPALFGAVFAQLAASNWRIAAIALPICVAIYYVPFVPDMIKTLVAILLTVFLHVLLYKLKRNEAINEEKESN